LLLDRAQEISESFQSSESAKEKCVQISGVVVSSRTESASHHLWELVWGLVQRCSERHRY